MTTTGIEAIWAVLKRGIFGTFHHVSEEHLDCYLDAFTLLIDEGNVERHSLRRLEDSVDGMAVKRLTYKVMMH